MTSDVWTQPARLMDRFRTPTQMTTEELGDHLAQLVWESFTDFLGHDDMEIGIEDLGIETEDGIPHENAVEESLIFLMWAHTRGAQLAFAGRADEELQKRGLDAMHRAIFEDLVPHLKPNTILTSNTSSISITRLAARTDRPERFMGFHFMNPVPIMQLVELIRGIATNDETFKACQEVVARRLVVASVAALCGLLAVDQARELG